MSWAIIFLLSATIIVHQSVTGSCAESPDKVHITYTGNMGVVISSDKSAVWIDGLHKFYKPEYQFTPPAFIDSANEKLGHFKTLQWVLFSHFHKDHFDAGLVNDLIKQQPEIIVSGGSQVIDSIKGSTYNAWNVNGRLNAGDAENVSVEAFNLAHTWPARHSDVQNLMYSVRIGGFRITHLGDAVEADNAYRQPAFLNADVLIVPYWLLMNDKWKQILQQTKARKVIATHIGPDEQVKPPSGFSNIDVILFDDPGECIVI